MSDSLVRFESGSSPVFTGPVDKINRNKGLGKLFNSIMSNIKIKTGTWIGKKLLAAPLSPEEKRSFEKLKQENERINSVKINQNKETELDSLIIKPQIKSDKWVVVFNGMGDRFEKHVEGLVSLADSVQANVITFNYRGVGESMGRATSAADLVEDGESVLQYLIKEGVRPESIAIYGHSMGAGVGAEILKTHPKCSFVSESTFRSFSSAITAKKGKVYALILRKSGWNLKPFEALQDRRAENTLTIVHRHDPTIPYDKASLHKAARKENLEIGRKRIKIGSKHRHVGEGIKDLHMEGAKRSKEGEKVSADYRTLKERKLLRFLPHPHQRIMDRIIGTALEFPEGITESDKERLERVSEQFRAEDEMAYEKMVEVFQEFLGIQRDEQKD